MKKGIILILSIISLVLTFIFAEMFSIYHFGNVPTLLTSLYLLSIFSIFEYFSISIMYIVKKIIKKEKIEKDQITLKLENIEYLLMLLKQKNKEMYDEVYKEYNEMINSESDLLTLTPISIQSLIALEGKIEFYLNYSKNTTNNIFDYLSNLKKEYLNNFQNNDGEITKLTLKDIDNLYENFLKVKSEYLVKDQLQILKDVAFLYVMEIKEDDTIKLSDLNDGYFNDNLKYIMITIMSLVEEGIIQDDILVNLNAELNSYDIYNIIKSIEFEKQNVKIKK